MLYDYEPLANELPIRNVDSISRAIAKLDFRVTSAKNLATTAIKTVANLQELENVTDKEAALLAKISELETELENLPKHIYISETAYNMLAEIDPNTIYYIYTDD